MALEILGYTMCRDRLWWLVSLPLDVSILVYAWLEGWRHFSRKSKGANYRIWPHNLWAIKVESKLHLGNGSSKLYWQFHIILYNIILYMILYYTINKLWISYFRYFRLRLFSFIEKAWRSLILQIVIYNSYQMYNFEFILPPF